jgi:hypothetical protein
VRDALAFTLLMVGLGLLVEVATSPTPSAWRTVIGFMLIIAAAMVGMWAK